MIREISCGAVIFIKNKEIRYLLLHYEAGHWGFVKGNMEENESKKDTLIREVKEETGILDIKILDNFKHKFSYFYQKESELVSKDVIFFLAESKTKEVKLSFEHIGYKWLNFDGALKQLKFKNQKELLIKANDFLKNIR